MLVVIKQFLLLVSCFQFQLRRTSNSCQWCSWAEGPVVTGKPHISGIFPLHASPPGNWGKKAYLEHIPFDGLYVQDGSQGRTCAWLVLSLFPIYWVWHFALLEMILVECSFVIPWHKCTFHFAVISTMAALLSDWSRAFWDLILYISNAQMTTVDYVQHI